LNGELAVRTAQSEWIGVFTGRCKCRFVVCFQLPVVFRPGDNGVTSVS